MSLFVLDCTLRDGGYINNFNFGFNVIQDIIFSLSKAKIDVVECGFLKDGSSEVNFSLFENVNQIETIVPESSHSLFVSMIQLGKFDLKKLPVCNGGVKGIRLTFHKNEIKEALEAGRFIKEKGYQLFFQPVGTTSYSDDELILLVESVNKLNPSVFYIVDTLGIMNSEDISHVFGLVDKCLNKNIHLGFHSHNNLQLSFANAQTLFSLKLNRDIYIDSSLNGMGRGAGNLCTELICSYLNNKMQSKYDVNLLIQLIDNYISPLRNKYQWGYSVAYYLSAINNCHPNYATFLLNKKTLTISDISLILSSINREKSELFDESLIKRLYFDFINKDSGVANKDVLENLSRIFKNKDVLVVAPGKNSINEAKKIQSFIKSNNCLVIGVNEDYKFLELDYLFVSNKKKLQTALFAETRLILTSNLFEKELSNQIFINYELLCFNNDDIKDNAGLMCLKMLDYFEVKNIYLAGFDGFSADDFSYKFANPDENKQFAERINSGFKETLKTFKANVIFLTKSLYE